MAFDENVHRKEITAASVELKKRSKEQMLTCTLVLKSLDTKIPGIGFSVLMIVARKANHVQEF